jgi:hypothetical protein
LARCGTPDAGPLWRLATKSMRGRSLIELGARGLSAPPGTDGTAVIITLIRKLPDLMAP